MLKQYMPPVLFDKTLQLSISDLKKWGYLEPNRTVDDKITWSKNGRETGSISIYLNTYPEQSNIELDYKFKGEPRNYIIRLIKIPSNIGKGFIWYFLCPMTNKKCRKLYSIDGYFFHREAFKKGMYQSQTRSKQYRLLEQTFGKYFKSEKLVEQFYYKHSRRFYGGKPTKKNHRLQNQLEQAKSILLDDVVQNMINKRIKRC